MLRALPGRLWRGLPWLASATIHLALVGVVLALAAPAVPRLPPFIAAQLIAPGPEPVPERPAPPARSAAPPPTPPKAATRLPRLIEAPPPRVASVPEIADASPPEPVRQRPAPEPPRRDVSAPVPEPPPRSPEPHGRAQSWAVDAPPVTGAPSHAAPGAGVGPLAGPGDLPIGARAVSGPTGIGGGTSGTAETGRGTEAGLARNSTPGTDGRVTRTAIPRGGYQVQPRYPPGPRRQGVQGTTVLRVFVAADGRVTEVALERTAGHVELDEAAAEAVRRWRFEPALSGDTPVAMWVLLPVEFRLK